MFFQRYLMTVFVVLAGPAMAMDTVHLQTTPVAPVRFEQRGDVYFADFGEDVYGNLQIQFPSVPSAGTITVRLGEKLASDGTIDQKPPGSINYRKLQLITKPDQKNYRLRIPLKRGHRDSQAMKMPESIGNVTPFRYAEIEGAPLPLKSSDIRQLFVHDPFDEAASSFESSDETLNEVWKLCKHTMKATTAFGVYIDGERERKPYEADAYINLLSQYACDLDPHVARNTFEYLLKHPTWPTEWSLHMPMMAAADYEATGSPVLAEDNYDALTKKLLSDKAGPDGLLRAPGIVDWPPNERDNYNDGRPAAENRQMVGPEINTVVNAFYYHALKKMAVLAHALKKDDDARKFEAQASQVYQSFNRVFFDSERKIYIDGAGSKYASLHANMFPLAFGLVPTNHIRSVADFVESRGMACSVYGAQYLLEALFKVHRADAAIQLMAARTECSWWHMIEQGSTMTMEAWDPKFKSNLTWNHAWGAAPANIISRFVLGVRPIKPGYTELRVAPQLGKLKWANGKVPTSSGPVLVSATNGAVFNLKISIPAGSTAQVAVPVKAAGRVSLDNKTINVMRHNQMFILSSVEPGNHFIESR